MTAIVEQLLSPNPEIRHAALSAAVGTTDHAVVEILAARLADAKFAEPERQLAAEALSKSALPEIGAMLLPELAAESAFTRTMAVMALGGQGSAEVVVALLGGLADPVNTVRNGSERRCSSGRSVCSARTAIPNALARRAASTSALSYAKASAFRL